MGKLIKNEKMSTYNDITQVRSDKIKRDNNNYSQINFDSSTYSCKNSSNHRSIHTNNSNINSNRDSNNSINNNNSNNSSSNRNIHVDVNNSNNCYDSLSYNNRNYSNCNRSIKIGNISSIGNNTIFSAFSSRRLLHILLVTILFLSTPFLYVDAVQQKNNAKSKTTSPAMYNYQRVAYMGYKRISALNTDFDLPLRRFDRFGEAIAVLGDLDKDRMTIEVAVGAPGSDVFPDGENAGALYILYMNTYGTIMGYSKISPDEGTLANELSPGMAFGSSVAHIGDLNGDGVDDIVVGAPYKDLTGSLYVLFMTPEGRVRNWTKINGRSGLFFAPLIIGDEFGCSVANIGDLDGDGVFDLGVGACGDDDLYEGQLVSGSAGAIYILWMNRDGTVKKYQKISAREGDLIIPPRDGDRFGSSIALLGDLNRNGAVEIAIGTSKADGPNLKREIDVGQVYIIELQHTGKVRDFMIVAPWYVNIDPHYSSYMWFNGNLCNRDYFGSAVGSIDVDRDGLYDLVVGARGRDSTNLASGAAYTLYLDWNGALWTWDEVITDAGLDIPLAAGEHFGASMGFINDYFTSLLIGAPGEPFGSQGGSVYMLFIMPY